MKKSAAMPMTTMTKPNPCARIDLGDKFEMPDVDMDDEVTLTIKGTVKALRQDEYGNSMEITMTALKAKTKPETMKEEMDALHESRKM